MDLSRIVGSISAAIAIAAWALWDIAPLPVVAAMTYGSLVGFTVAIAATDWLASRSTGLIGKVGVIPPAVTCISNPGSVYD